MSLSLRHRILCSVYKFCYRNQFLSPSVPVGRGSFDWVLGFRVSTIHPPLTRHTEGYDNVVKPRPEGQGLSGRYEFGLRMLSAQF